MKKCSLCKRELTNNMDNVLVNNRFTFVVDDTDYRCDSCDARYRASDCVKIINAEMSSARGIASNGKIHNSEAYLNKRLSDLKAYWVVFFTSFLKGDDRIKYRYWLDVFSEYVEDNAQTSKPLEVVRSDL